VRAKRGWLLIVAIFVGTWLCARWLTGVAIESQPSAKSATKSSSAYDVHWQAQSAAASSVASLSGTVRQSDGSPIASVLVCAASAHDDLMTGRAPFCTTGDAVGKYRLEGLAQGAYHITATANGFIPGTPKGVAPLRLSAEERTNVDIVLQGGGAIVAGVVLDAAGGTVPHARVRAVRLLEPMIALEVESDDDGHFVLSVPAGTVGLFAEAEGYAQGAAGYVAPTTEAEITMVPESFVSGTVVSAEDGEPVAHVEVRALNAEMPSVAVYRSGFSDERGRFRVAGLKQGAYVLIAKGGPWHGQLAEPVEVSVADGVRDLTIQVGRGHELVGHVLVEGDGTPCPEGAVVLGPPEPELHGTAAAKSNVDGVGPPQFARIEAEGRVHFQGVPPAFYYVNVECNGHVLRSGPTSLFVQSAPPEPVTWKVASSPKLKVRVVDGRGTPLAHESFDLFRMGDSSITEMTLQVGANGELVTPGLPEGDYEVAARGGAERGERVRVSLRANSGVTQVVLKLHGTGQILVEVKSQDEKPVEKLQVYAKRAVASVEPKVVGKLPTGEDIVVRGSAADDAAPIFAEALGQGRYRLGALPAGPYVVTAEDELGFNPSVSTKSAVQVSDGATASAELRLSASGVIRGHVVDERGERMPNVWVAATRAASEAANPAAAFSAVGPNKRVLTDTSGDFVLEGLVGTERYTVRASESYGSGSAQREVAPGADVELRLPAPATLSGTVVDASGAPVPVFSVQALSRDAASTRQQQVHDAQGKFTLRGLSPGHVEVSVTSPSGTTGTQHYQLSSKQSLANVRIVLGEQRADMHSVAVRP
jgi:hypothetical protein